MRESVVGMALLSTIWAGAATAQEAKESASPIEMSLSYAIDLIGVVDGGLAQRGHVLDNLDLVVDADLESVFGWRGAAFHLDVLNNSGSTPNDVAGSLQGIDNIEVSSQRLRLFEAWLEQSLGDASTLRVGLYDLNSEFYANDSAGYLIAPAFGIGSEIAATGPNGPSIFPSTALGARFDTRFGGGLFLRAALVNAHSGVLGDPGGVDTSFDDGGLLITEAGLETDRKLAFGVWRYTRRQADIRDVDAFGAPVQRIAQGAYLVFEQPLVGSAEAWSSSVFVRAGVSEGETTAFAGGWQAGVLVKRPFAGRADSVLSLGVNQGILSDGYRSNQADLGLSMTQAEMQVELTYSDKLLPYLTIQPDLQWIRRPGGDRNVRDAVVAGLRLLVES